MDEFIPSEARLGQLLVETPGGDTRLEFSVEVEFGDGEFDGEPGTPFLRISNLTAPGRSWRAIANQSWGEADADPGRLDAMILLFRVSNPVEIRSLQFGEFGPGGRIEAAVQLVADFESEADRDSLEEVEIELASLPLTLGPLRISTRLEKQLRGDDEATREAVAPFVDLDDYGPLEKVPGGFAFPPEILTRPQMGLM